MLRDGHFIQEELPKIGAHYVPQLYARPTTPEERLMQDIVLGEKPHRPSPMSVFFERLLGV